MACLLMCGKQRGARRTDLREQMRKGDDPRDNSGGRGVLENGSQWEVRRRIITSCSLEVPTAGRWCRRYASFESLIKVHEGGIIVTVRRRITE